MPTARTLWAYLFSSTTFSEGDVCGSASMCDGPHAGFPRLATLAAPKEEWPYTEATQSGAAPTSQPEGVFRHKRLMELVELSGRTTGPLGYTWPTTAYAIGGTATLALRDSSISASAAARAPPPHPPGPQDLPRDYEPDGAAGGLSLSRSTPRQADDTTTRPSGSGPTCQSDDRDSEPDYLLRPTRHGQGGTLRDYIAVLLNVRQLIELRTIYV